MVAVPAGASTFSAQQGGVKATLTYNKTTTTRLTVVRNGATLMDDVPNLEPCGGAPCAPSGYSDDPPLRVLDLDADGEPEVVYSAYTGGAHCCSIAQVYRLNAAANGYGATALSFGDPGFSIKDLDSDGRPEWLTGDDAFAYRFTAYAFSALPVLVMRFGSDGFTDVTGSYLPLVRRDAKHWWRIYHRVRRRKDGTELGAAAAWAADQYRLGGRAAALARLRREARAGRLKGPDAHGLRFVAVLDRFLHGRGY